MITARTEAMKQARLERGWTCVKLAHEAGLSGSCVTRIERGGSASPETAKKLADSLDRGVTELFTVGNR